MRLFILFILICIGVFLGFIPMIILSLSSGHGIMGLLKPEVLMGDNTMLTRAILLINHLTMFILPGLAWGYIHYKRNLFKGLDLKSFVRWQYIAMGILFLLVTYPIVAKSYEINKLWDLPDWMSNAEAQTAELLKKLLTMNSLASLILNLIVIAIIPGMGEELIFRGIIQKELSRYFKSPYVAIILASVIFSAFHFQFEGFLPRMFLGLILGLLYFWTGTLWVPILVHAFNNGMQVLITYFNPAMATEDLESTISVEWYYLIASVILSFAVGYWFIQRKAKKTNDAENAASISENLS